MVFAKLAENVFKVAKTCRMIAKIRVGMNWAGLLDTSDWHPMYRNSRSVIQLSWAQRSNPDKRR